MALEIERLELDNSAVEFSFSEEMDHFTVENEGLSAVHLFFRANGTFGVEFLTISSNEYRKFPFPVQHLKVSSAGQCAVGVLGVKE